MSLAMSTADTRRSDRRWWVLAVAVVVAAQFIFVVDAFIVNVAIPSIRTELHATTGEIQAVIVLYQITFATLIITGGRLGDIRGSKPVFLLGLLGFTAASLWCGLARSGAELVTARAVQGAAAALMIPQVLATIHLLFRDAQRGQAFGIYGFTLGFGAAVGFGLGGWLVALNLDDLGWRTIFFVNVPIGLVLTGAAVWLMPSSAGKPGTRLDLIGAVVLLVALLCLIGPLLLGDDAGWAWWLFAVMAAGALLLVSMWPLERWVEHDHNGLPLVHLDLLRDRGFAIGLLAVFFFTFANISFYLMMTLYMQLALHFSPLQSGSAVLPLAIGFALMSRVAGPRAQRRGITALLEGCGVQITGLVILGSGVAMGLSAPSCTRLAARRVRYRQAHGDGAALRPGPGQGAAGSCRIGRRGDNHSAADRQRRGSGRDRSAVLCNSGGPFRSFCPPGMPGDSGGLHRLHGRISSYARPCALISPSSSRGPHSCRRGRSVPRTGLPLPPTSRSP